VSSERFSSGVDPAGKPIRRTAQRFAPPAHRSGVTTAEKVQPVQFDDFVHDRQRALFRFAVVLCGDPVLGQDLVQDVLGRAFERWQQVSAADDVNAYVRRMLVNEFLGFRRRLTRTRPMADIDEGLLPSTPDHADASADRSELAAGLATLPRQQRAAIVLRFYAGLPFAEVASCLGCREASARAYVTRALTTLRIQLAAPVAPIRPVDEEF
jgi:RNA polymerase sigma-70 factor (sigma-E family)